MCAGCQDKYAGRHADTHQAMRLSLMGRKEEESFERQGWRGVQKKRTASPECGLRQGSFWKREVFDENSSEESLAEGGGFSKKGLRA